MDILLILLDIFKMSIDSTCRWGDLTEEDAQIVTNAPFLKVFHAPSVLRRGPFTDSLTTSVE